MQRRSVGKPVILIPAYNEEKLIGRTIDLIKGTGVDAGIIVVNDGSTDRTAEIAISKGCKVVSLPKNFEKANAFFAGIKEALKTNPAAVVTIDADLVKLTGASLKNIIDDAAKATKNGKARMFVAEPRERSFPGMWFFSGFRAFSLPALYKLRASKLKAVPKGFGLEVFLNDFFKYGNLPERLISARLNRYDGAVFEKQYRVQGSQERQAFEIDLTVKRFKMRTPKRRILLK